MNLNYRSWDFLNDSEKRKYKAVENYFVKWFNAQATEKIEH